MDTKQIIQDMFPNLAARFPVSHKARIEKMARWCDIHLRLEGMMPYQGDIFWMCDLETVEEMDEVLQTWEGYLKAYLTP